jgi:transcriptional regulator with XRE-family HTH domain
MSMTPKSQLKKSTVAEMRPERIGHRLYLLRAALGLKSTEMADTLGIERTYWSRFEGGKRPITDTVAALLVDRFGVTLDFLILGRWDRLPLDLAQKMRELDDETS